MSARYCITEQKTHWQLSVWNRGWWLSDRWVVVGRHLTEDGALSHMQDLISKKKWPQPAQFFDSSGDATGQQR